MQSFLHSVFINEFLAFVASTSPQRTGWLRAGEGALAFVSLPFEGVPVSYTADRAFPVIICREVRKNLKTSQIRTGKRISFKSERKQPLAQRPKKRYNKTDFRKWEVSAWLHAHLQENFCWTSGPGIRPPGSRICGRPSIKALSAAAIW